LLDLWRGKAISFGHDGDDWPVEVREYIDRQARHRQSPVKHHDVGNRDDEHTVAQRLRDEEIEHRAAYRIWLRSSAPSATTRNPETEREEYEVFQIGRDGAASTFSRYEAA